MQVNRDEVIGEKGPLFEVEYHSILLSLCLTVIEANVRTAENLTLVKPPSRPSLTINDIDSFLYKVFSIHRI